MEFLRPLVDLKDWGLKKPPSKQELKKDPKAEWEPKPHLHPGMLERWVNRGPVPDDYRVELSNSILKKHLAKENSYYYRASPTNKRVLLCVDLDSHDGQTDCDKLAKFIKDQFFPKAYFEASTRGYHGYFILDLGDFPRRNLKPILANLTKVMESRRIAEGFKSDVDRIKGTFNTPHWMNGRWKFLKGDRGSFAKLPMLPGRSSSLIALKNTATFTVDNLLGLIERDKHYLPSIKINKPRKSVTTCHDNMSHPKATTSGLSQSYRGHVDNEPKGDESLKDKPQSKETLNELTAKDESQSSPHFLHPRSICCSPTSIPEAILQDTYLRKIYGQAKELFHADPLKRMHTAYTLAWYTDRSHLASSKSLTSFYVLLELKGTASLEKTEERAESVINFRQSTTSGISTFHAEKWLPPIQKFITEEIKEHPLVWPQSHTDRVIPEDSLSAVLWIATKHALQEPLLPHYRFSLAGDQLNGYLKSLYNAPIPSISSPLGNSTKRRAALRMLILADLIVLRKNYTTGGTRGRSVGDCYGLGINHPRYTQYTSLCENLGEATRQITPRWLLSPSVSPKSTEN